MPDGESARCNIAHRPVMVASVSNPDPVLSTLMLPFADGVLPWPDPMAGRVLFLRARAGQALPMQALRWQCEQGFRPHADALAAARIPSRPRVALAQAPFGHALVLPPRQRNEARALFARALQAVGEGGLVIASQSNSEGARSLEDDLEHLAGSVRSLSKNKCRVFWTVKQAAAVDAGLLSQWSVGDAPRPILDGRFLSRPGLFAWDRIDPASALLAECLPTDLAGEGADLGAGFGYLSAEIVARCPGVVRLSLFEAEAAALALANANLQKERARLADRSPPGLAFHWHDVTGGVPGRFDFIVSNPPFHIGGADRPDLGRAFIRAAAAALLPGGSLWLVANRHLPYEGVLAENFASVRDVRQQDGFKVVHALKARA